MPKIPGGYYLKARIIQNSEIAHAPPHVREIWDWLIKEANHKDIKINGKTIYRGQCVRSYKDIQNGLAWYIGWRKKTYSKHEIETSMKWLKKRTMVTTTKTTRGMLITIVNYNKFQDTKNYETYRKPTREPQTSDTINKNVKNEKKNIVDYAPQIYEFYLSEIQPSQKTRQRALKNINRWLKKHPYEDLIRAISNYKITCNGRDPKYRKDPANFFGVNEVFHIDFLPENFIPEENKCKTPAWL